jgi:hypothetical protein
VSSPPSSYPTYLGYGKEGGENSQTKERREGDVIRERRERREEKRRGRRVVGEKETCEGKIIRTMVRTVTEGNRTENDRYKTKNEYYA